jgi:hypothetical protein
MPEAYSASLEETQRNRYISLDLTHRGRDMKRNGYRLLSDLIMRQVPHYLIVGNGRVARHIQHYFSLLQLPYTAWHRDRPLSELHEKLAFATHVLILIQDSAIAPFIAEHLLQETQDCCPLRIHFSGSLVIEQAWGAHPLMAFSDSLYGLPQYRAVPFVLDHDAPSFADLLPGLPNRQVRLHTALKPKYHALCVLSGNFSCLLWQKLFDAFEQELNLPPDLAHSYLMQQTHNLIRNAKDALTGPLVRGDASTIEKNIAALAGDPYQDIYKSFVRCYQKTQSKNVNGGKQ